jgi:type I restriction-modification system DNA methylase subunit
MTDNPVARSMNNDVWLPAPQTSAKTANKQLNFVQHIATILGIKGRAAVVLSMMTSSSRAVRGRRSAAICSTTSIYTR